MQKQTRFLVYDGKAGPVARFLLALAGFALAAISLVLGFVFFLVLLGVGLVVGLIMWSRLRSIRRQVDEAAARQRSGGSTVIDGDFTVVQRTESPPRDAP